MTQEEKNQTPRRTLISLISLLILALMTWVLSMVFVYFNTGAQWGLPEGYAYNTLLKNAPETVWVNKIPQQGIAPDSFLLMEIETAYREAWQALHYVFQTKDQALLQDYFAESLWPELQELLGRQAAYQVEQTDLAHQLDLHTFSLDKQIVAFADHGVRIKKNIREVATGQTVYTGMQEADFDVVMTLDD
ncbi:MAG: hypothetical protein H6555_13015, partial [Lewinellaceae bacterium]|nr:hypothetical protein [Lewinellaceae bacterium]